MASVGSVPLGVPRPLRRATSGTAAGLLLIAALIMGVTLSAQHQAVVTAQASDYPPGLYSLPRHVLAMVVLAGFTVVVSTLTRLRGDTWMAFLVMVGVALGPMGLVAAPVRAGFVASSSDTVISWHLAVAAPIVLLLALTTGWNVRCLQQGFERSLPGPAAGSLFAAAAAGAVLLQLFDYSTIGQAPGLLPIIGWAVVAGALLAIVGGEAVAWKASALLLLGSAATVTVVFLAYRRDGGWPGVAGWELNGMESPIILYPSAILVLLAAPLVGLIRFAAHAIVVQARDDSAMNAAMNAADRHR